MDTTIESTEVPTAEEQAVCTACGTAVKRPGAGQWAALWQAGWRWLGTLGLYSCPDCPEVVSVIADGRHVAGPGTERAAVWT